MLKHPNARLRSQRSRWRNTCAVLMAGGETAPPAAVPEPADPGPGFTSVNARAVATSAYAPPNHQTVCQRLAWVNSGAAMSMAVEPIGTQVDQTPMAAPRL